MTMIDTKSVAMGTGETIGIFWRTVANSWWFNHADEKLYTRHCIEKLNDDRPDLIEDLVGLERARSGDVRAIKITLGFLDRRIMALNSYVSVLWKGLCYSGSSSVYLSRLAKLQKRVNRLMETF
jgi:hypothetical protein